MLNDRFNLKKFCLAQRFLTLALLGALLVSAGVDQGSALAISAKQPASPPSSSMPVELSQAAPRPPRPSRQIVRQVRRDLAERFNVSRQSLKLIDYSRETWSNGCLGLEAPNERCTGAQVEGWRIEMTDGQQNWIYRTDLTAQMLRPELTAEEAQIPPDVSARVLEAIAKQVRVPVATLRITESKPATFDGCMGIYEPNRACTQIAISGWQLIVGGNKQYWVYHISEDGSRVAQNATATSSLQPAFNPSEEMPEEPGSGVVFRSTQSGGLAGIVTERTLFADGTIQRVVRRPVQNQPTESVVEKRISEKQVQQFQKLLEDQRFPNLNRLRYWTDANLADYPSMSATAMGSSVDYIDLEMERLPVALQSVLRAWDRL
jgi:hypothetical protein